MYPLATGGLQIQSLIILVNTRILMKGVSKNTSTNVHNLCKKTSNKNLNILEGRKSAGCVGENDMVFLLNYLI